MKETSRISIIVPVYKVEAYLEKCILSLINQTYHEIEILLIDDGSPDRSGAICDEYALKDDRIKVVHKPNAGQAIARNTGIEIATGDYLAFVDSDDFLHPEMCGFLLRNLEEGGADIAICAFKMVYDHADVSDHTSYKTQLFTNIEALDLFFTFSAINMTVVWNKLYKKSLFDELRFPVDSIREDEAISYQLIYNSGKISITNRLMYFYFQRDDSFVHVKDARKELCLADTFEERLRFFADKNLGDIHLLALKRYCLWLLAEAFLFDQYFTDNPDFYKNMDERRYKYIDCLLKDYSLTAFSRLIYRFSKKHPYWLGSLANQRLNRYNLLTKLAYYFFDDHKLMLSSI